MAAPSCAVLAGGARASVRLLHPLRNTAAARVLFATCSPARALMAWGPGAVGGGSGCGGGVRCRHTLCGCGGVPAPPSGLTNEQGPPLVGLNNAHRARGSATVAMGAVRSMSAKATSTGERSCHVCCIHCAAYSCCLAERERELEAETHASRACTSAWPDEWPMCALAWQQLGQPCASTLLRFPEAGMRQARIRIV
jgi:hypothetical protein